jgi:hypothetical protein
MHAKRNSKVSPSERYRSSPVVHHFAGMAAEYFSGKRGKQPNSGRVSAGVTAKDPRDMSGGTDPESGRLRPAAAGVAGVAGVAGRPTVAPTEIFPDNSGKQRKNSGGSAGVTAEDQRGISGGTGPDAGLGRPAATGVAGRPTVAPTENFPDNSGKQRNSSGGSAAVTAADQRGNSEVTAAERALTPTHARGTTADRKDPHPACRRSGANAGHPPLPLPMVAALP